LIVLFDTNVWVSALHFSKGFSTPRQALELGKHRDVIATCDEIEEEIRRVLTVRCGWPLDHVQWSFEAAFTQSIRVTLQHTVSICRDPKDNMFLECAQRANADVLVAGDKDLLILERFGNTRILTPAQYLREADIRPR
jgi:uncharacterized protein